MMDSTSVISFQEMQVIAQTISLARKTIAVQWFLGNIFLVVGALLCIAVPVLLRFIPLASGPRTNEDRKAGLKGVALLTGIFVIGLLAVQLLLNFWGVILWLLCYGVFLALWFKWRSWFVRTGSGIPIGWTIVQVFLFVVFLLGYNVLPSLISVGKDAEKLFLGTSVNK